MTVVDFRDRARRGTPAVVHLVPVWRDVLLDAETPVAAFAKLRHGPFAFLLESAPAGGETWARYTFMGTAPRAAWKLADGVVQDWTPALGWHNDRRPVDPLSDLEALLKDSEPVELPEIGEEVADGMPCALPHVPAHRHLELGCRRLKDQRR